MQEKLNSSLDNVANNSVYSEALLFMDKVLVGERWEGSALGGYPGDSSGTGGAGKRQGLFHGGD